MCPIECTNAKYPFSGGNCPIQDTLLVLTHVDLWHENTVRDFREKQAFSKSLRPANKGIRQARCIDYPD